MVSYANCMYHKHKPHVSHSIHVWYISLHFVYFFMVNVAKHTSSDESYGNRTNINKTMSLLGLYCVLNTHTPTSKIGPTSTPWTREPEKNDGFGSDGFLPIFSSKARPVFLGLFVYKPFWPQKSFPNSTQILDGIFTYTFTYIYHQNQPKCT